MRDDTGRVVGVRAPEPGSQEEKDAFDNASGFLGTFAGVGAKTADLAKLKVAKELEAAGWGKSVIWEKTGWFRSPDSKWRFEISDEGAKLNVQKALEKERAKWDQARHALSDAVGIRMIMDKKGLPADEAVKVFENVYKRKPSGGADLIADFSTGIGEIQHNLKALGINPPKTGMWNSKEVLEHPELYKAYPELAKRKLGVDELPMNVRGQFDPRMKEVTVSPEAVKEGSARSTALHEIQHAIQDIEGFATGGAPTKTTPQVVKSLAENIKTTQEALAEAKRFNYPKKEVEQLEKELKSQKEELEFLRASLKNQLDAYMRLAGEAEARTVQARAVMDAEDRAIFAPWDTYDVEWSKLIVRHGSKGK